jgi:predicted nuclease of predicted toxin-antitoxin system
MPLSPTLSQWLVKQGHDAIHADQIGMDRSADTAIIEFAKREVRTIITADLDYPRLLALAAATEPSLVLFRGGQWSDDEIISRMSTLLNNVSELEFKYSILVVEQDRIRRRRLPIGPPINE